MEERVIFAALAGLLHDVGKIALRAEESLGEEWNEETAKELGYKHSLATYTFIQNYVPKPFRARVRGAVYYHNPKELADWWIQQADRLSSGERRSGSDEQADQKEARLNPVLANVSLDKPKPVGFKHHLAVLSVQDNLSYPTREPSGSYSDLWGKMLEELNNWKNAMGPTWESQEVESFYTILLAIFQKYLWCVPSATPWQKETEKSRRVWPDISLYDHSRLTSAIAACLAYDEVPQRNEDGQPVAILVRGDVSGIQKFIYSISSPESETEHVAKRLRGRSFYLQLLIEVIVDWLLRKIGLPSACAIYVGGGRFDLLLPQKSKDQLEGMQKDLSSWFLKTFHGELGLWISSYDAYPEDFADIRDISKRLDEALEKIKQQKWKEHLAQDSFFIPSKEELWHVCSVCRLTPVSDSGMVCSLCRQHEAIGKNLPYASYIAFCYGERPALESEKIVDFDESPFGIHVAFLCNDEDKNRVKSLRGDIHLFALNYTENFIVPGFTSSFRFLANTAPRASQDFRIPGMQPIQSGDVLHFEAIAELSTGAKRIGVLKADVDRLGLIMGEGLNDDSNQTPDKEHLRPTLSRMAALSRTLDLFFSGHLNRICAQIFQEWRATPSHVHATSVNGLFYIIYSGGDDLFIVGPWDQILHLANKLRNEFHAFTGGNLNLTLSAGYVQVKPRFPVQKFAELVDDAEKIAKNSGRNRIALFGEALLWDEVDCSIPEDVSFSWMFLVAQDWVEKIEANKLPRGLIYDLGGIFRKHRDQTGKLQPLWTPRLYYTLARRVNEDLRKELEGKLFRAISSRKILVPVSIASLLIREERR